MRIRLWHKAFAVVSLISLLSIPAVAQRGPGRYNRNQAEHIARDLETRVDYFERALDKQIDWSWLNGTSREDFVESRCKKLERETDQIKKELERAFTGKFNKHYDEGTYACACCGLALFGSEAKFDSGTGWPSFYQPVAEDRVAAETDTSYGMTRTEVLCARCDAHLGHVFKDGPEPTGLRYCMNSAALEFEPKK